MFYKDIKEELHNNREYETLLFLILKIEYAFDDNAIIPITIFQVKPPYIKHLENKKHDIKVSNEILYIICHIYEKMNVQIYLVKNPIITTKKYLIYMERNLVTQMLRHLEKGIFVIALCNIKRSLVVRNKKSFLFTLLKPIDS